MSCSRTLLGSQTYLKAKAVLLLITILAASPAHSEQVTIPDTAAGRVLAAWLEAFNSSDKARFGIYQQKYEPAPDLPPDAVMAFRARTVDSISSAFTRANHCISSFWSRSAPATRALSEGSM